MQRIAITLTAIVLTACSKERDSNSAPAKDVPPQPKETPSVPVKEMPPTPDKEIPKVPAKEAEQRSIEPAKDGFTITFKSKFIEWTADGMMSGDISDLKAIGTASDIKGVELVLLESGTCTEGQIETKKFGIIRIRESGNFGADFILDPKCIKDIRSELKKFPAFK